jgi:hypothetical protein
MGNLFSNTNKKTEEISSNQINQFVTKMLQNKDVNLSFVPDSVEAKIYEKLLTITIQELDQILATVKIQFLNQEITIHMNPIPSNK